MRIPDPVRAFLDNHVVGALVTRSASGQVHQSLVYHAREGDRLFISTETQRRKARDARETGWASLCVMGHERPYPSVTVAGRAAIETQGIGPRTAVVTQRMLGLEETPEPQTDEALAAVRRVLLVIEVEHVGPASYLEG
jgi:PPOX class probable F420-dependent enzyme